MVQLRSLGQSETDAVRVTRSTLTVQLEEALRIDILEGVLRPGQRIRASEMSRRYGVSATPFREALQRLAVENLVDLDPRLGATVALISADDLRDVYEMIHLLDALALNRSILRGDDAWLSGVQRAFDVLADAIARQEAIGGAPSDEIRQRTTIEWSTAHWQFHYALYQACGSPWLLRFVQTMHRHSERYRMLTMRGDLSMHRDSRHEHELILRPALRRDAESAVGALHDHLDLTVNMLVAALTDHRLKGEQDNVRR